MSTDEASSPSVIPAHASLVFQEVKVKSKTQLDLRWDWNLTIGQNLAPGFSAEEMGVRAGDCGGLWGIQVGRLNETVAVAGCIHP